MLLSWFCNGRRCSVAQPSAPIALQLSDILARRDPSLFQFKIISFLFGSGLGEWFLSLAQGRIRLEGVCKHGPVTPFETVAVMKVCTNTLDLLWPLSSSNMTSSTLRRLDLLGFWKSVFGQLFLYFTAGRFCRAPPTQMQYLLCCYWPQKQSLSPPWLYFTECDWEVYFLGNMIK